MSLGNVGQKKEACLTFSQLAHDFPKASGNITERAKSGEAAPRLLMRAALPAGRAARSNPLPAEETRPLAAEEFRALMAPLGPFESRPILAVAVSGGADSLALCLLTDCWAREHDGTAVD